MKFIRIFGTLACGLWVGQALISAQTPAKKAPAAPAKKAAAAPANSAAGAAPTVTVSTGQLRGSLTPDGVATFKNIPFAQPPVGDLRWKAPQPAKAWTGVREATAFGPMCHQSGNTQNPHSEDCLQLNVWTPKWPMTATLPVLVWIHGGGNTAGSAVEPLFNGDVLAKRGVVYVTVNYRLGIFGFFAHPGLTKESPHKAAGNYGIADQILALQWVQKNIAKFGGNPANVTIMGESAGAADVNALLASPLTKGLFVRVIAQSGPMGGQQLSLADSEKRGVELATRLGFTGDDSLAKLRALSDTDLMAKVAPPPAARGAAPGAPAAPPAARGAAPGAPAAPPAARGAAPAAPAPGGGGNGIGINVDGWVLPEPSVKIFSEGKEQKVPLLIGNNSQEMQPRAAANVRDQIKERYGPLADRALKAYGVDGPNDPAPDPENGTALLQFTTDNQFRCGTVRELILHTTNGNIGYQYQWSRTVHGQEAQGAPHASEIPFIMGTLPVWQRMRNYNESDEKYAPIMQAYWTNFAKTGDPNGANLVKWPKFDAKARAYMDFTDAGPVVKEGLQRQACDLFIENEKRQK
jgi:para-nitrobenzyl esterase